MCGICGIVGRDAQSEKAIPVVRKMMDTLAHRGPDGHGLVKGDNFVFGHRRLAVIDIEHGFQPMQTEDGTITLIYNGEIYNYLELRQELIRDGVKFSTFSDTEVLLRMYQRYGIECIQKLNGMFAFAIYDDNEKRFYAARDHFGIKPFYYITLPDGSIVFASEIKALFHHQGINANLDKSSLNEYLTFQFCLGEKTLFREVHKLLPGHFLLKTSRNKRAKISKYWSMSYHVDTHHTKDYFIDELRSLLQSSVELQLRSDVSLGGYLSGGLDSSTVVTLASSLYGGNFRCFTGKFTEGRAYDESRYARIIAKENNCFYHEVVPTVNDFIECIPKLIYHMDEPAAGPGIFPQYIVSKLAKEHCTVVLGGQGGDEIFGGYARYLVAYLEQCIKGGIFETQEEGQHIVTLESVIRNLPLLKQYVPMMRSFWQEGLFEPMDTRYFRLISRSHNVKQFLQKDFSASYDRNAIFSRFQDVFNDPDTKSYFNKMTHFDQQTLLPALLQVEDRVSMAVSLESRVPLLDKRIAQLVASIPPAMKFEGGDTKHILKEAMSPRLPKLVMERKDKMGFPVPLGEWWNGPLKEFVSDILLSETCRQRGIFDTKALEHLLREEGQYGRTIWGVLCMELWFREFI